MLKFPQVQQQKFCTSEKTRFSMNKKWCAQQRWIKIANLCVRCRSWATYSVRLQIGCRISNVEVVTLRTSCTNFQVFAHFALQSSPMKLYFWYLSCKHFPEITHLYILFGPLFLQLKHFEASALLCFVKGILLDIGRNLWHSLVLQSQMNNFPYSLKKSVSCVKLFSLKNFTLSLN